MVKRKIFFGVLWLAFQIAVPLFIWPVEEKNKDPFVLVPLQNGCQIEYNNIDGVILLPSKGLTGYNVAPRLHTSAGRSWLVWEIAVGSRSGIGLYDLSTNQRRTFFPAELKDIGQIAPIWSAGGEPEGFILLAKDRQIDLFHYDIVSRHLIHLTQDTKVEHGFTLKKQLETLQIELDLLCERGYLVYDLVG